MFGAAKRHGKPPRKMVMCKEMLAICNGKQETLVLKIPTEAFWVCALQDFKVIPKMLSVHRSIEPASLEK